MHAGAAVGVGVGYVVVIFVWFGCWVGLCRGRGGLAGVA